MFAPYAQFWFEPIANYVCDKEDKNVGLHYFRRDLCTLLVSWNFMPDDSSRSKLVCTTLVNKLVMISADKSKLIFSTNIRKRSR